MYQEMPLTDFGEFTRVSEFLQASKAEEVIEPVTRNFPATSDNQPAEVQSSTRVYSHDLSTVVLSKQRETPKEGYRYSATVFFDGSGKSAPAQLKGIALTLSRVAKGEITPAQYLGV